MSNFVNQQQGNYQQVPQQQQMGGEFNQQAPGMPNAYQQPGMMPMSNLPPPPGTATQWMQRPNPMPGIPIGLEYLSQMQGLMVKQQSSLTEVVTGLDTNNKYTIMNMAGAQCYLALEDSDTCERMCCGARRGFQFRIVDNMGAEVIHVTRPFKCAGGCGILAFCCECAKQRVSVEAPPGTPIGYVKQAGSWWKPKFDILDEKRETILKIEGPCCILDGAMCCGDSHFVLKTLDGTDIGKVSKKYAGFVRELGTTADNFGIDFPLDLSVKVKAILLGALLLIDFMYFETPPANTNNNYN